MFNGSQQTGYTLTELMVIVAVISLLAAIALPLYGSGRKDPASLRSGRARGTTAADQPSHTDGFQSALCPAAVHRSMD